MASEHVIERTGSDFMINVIHTLNIDSVVANTGASFRSLHESLVSYGGQRNYKTKNFIDIENDTRRHVLAAVRRKGAALPTQIPAEWLYSPIWNVGPQFIDTADSGMYKLLGHQRTYRIPLNFYGEHMAKTEFIVDGKRVSVDGDPQMPLLYVLRDDLKLKNPKFGCGLAQCGACTVHLNGEPVRSCVLPVSAVKGKQVTTLSGLGTPDKPHPIQTAFVEEQALQCGYCINGWVMTAAAFLKQNPKATDAQIRDALAGLKCRCGAHVSIMRAIKRAQAQMA